MKRTSVFFVLLLSFVTIASPAVASSIDGRELAFWWALPFAGLLLSLAIMPIIASKLWHHHFGKIVAIWSLMTLGMIIQFYSFDHALHEVLETYLHHFIQFIIFILALYVICGGIKIDIITKPDPYFNTFYLAITTFVASWIGTTGAAMLFIRPFLNVNKNRISKQHLVIFFIFLVCNVGGSLTALGDPPLFLGFLNGIDFFWPTTNLFGPFITATIPLLTMFYFFDRRVMKKENPEFFTKEHLEERFIITLKGKRNIVMLVLAVSTIVLSGIWKPDLYLDIAGVKLDYPGIARDIILLALTFASIRYGNKEVRKDNQFTWEPFLEVLKVFAAIFITAAPVLAMLKVGEEGAFTEIIKLVNTSTGPNNQLYYWITGGLSSVLDNAPTYLVFFNIAGGDPQQLMTTLSNTLVAISCGSVFMGAMTYIGNAPNFMVKSIAESNDIGMPSFFGYIGWSILILTPVLILTSLMWL